MLLRLNDFLGRPALSAPILALAAAAVTGSGCATRRGEPADLVLHNGTVVTFDPAKPEARAIAVRGGSIAAVGDDAAVLALAGPATRRIDLAGRMVLPGLTDAHGHIRSLGEQVAGLDLRGVASVGEIARRVTERAAALPPGAWVTGGGWDQNLWPGERFPDHRPLTAAAPGRPVWLSRIDGHASWASRAAMDAAGITRATPDPPGGGIEHDARGEPTGLFIDNAQDLVARVQPKPDRAQIKAWILLALERCAAAGLTSVHDAGVSEEEAIAFRELADEGRLPLRVYLMYSGMPGAAAKDTVADLERLLAEPPLVDYKNRLTLRAVKLMIDGAMGSRGALFFEDYSDDPGNKGLFVMTQEQIESAAALALRRGWQVCTHAIGDRGIRLTLDLYEKLLGASGAADPRPRLEHLQCVTRADAARLKRLGVIASMQPSHATSDMYWADERVGAARGKGLYAWRWVLDDGGVIAAGSDFPVDPEKPLVGIHSGVTRQDLKHWPEGGWHPEQRMTLDEVLRAYTGGAAYAAFEEASRGRIGAGYKADLTVVGKDLRAIPSEDIAGAGIAFTIVGGRIVYEGR
ncbi:MAG: amidohydrolase [Candidatus Polarisedimenticolia bacterium]